jgi:menaquinone-dependent protoporphyrinogen oxidase
MRILVTFGSSRGGTEGLAQMVGDALREQGATVDVLPPRQVKHLDGYDAVVVGGALYAFRWHRDARHFVKRHNRELRDRPTFFFSSGPLDASARERVIPPVKGVQALMTEIGARGHETFGGRLTPDARGFVASKMAVKRSGDWRDPEHVREWTQTVTAAMQMPELVPA